MFYASKANLIAMSLLSIDWRFYQIVAVSFGIVIGCLSYTIYGTNTPYRLIMQDRIDNGDALEVENDVAFNAENDDAIRDKDGEASLTTTQVNQETTTATDEIFTGKIRSSVYPTKRLIRVLSPVTLKNIIVDSEKGCSKRQFLAYKCSKISCGGWGDREKGIVSAFLLALLTNRSFVIDISKPCDIENFMEPFIYNWTMCKRYLETLPPSNISEENYVVMNRNFYNNVQSIDFEKRWTQQAVVLYINAYQPVMNGIKRRTDSGTQMKWILNKTNSEIVHLILHTLFKPKPRLLNHLTDFIKNITYGRQLVCVHIRKGKNPSNPEDNNLPKGSPKEKTIFSFLKQYKNVNRYVIYVATDSDDVRNDAMSEFMNAVNINRTIVHIDRFRRAAKTTDICEGFYTVLFEQQLLSLCDKLLITRSNFGTIAAYLRGVSEELFLYQTETDKVIPTNITNIQSVYDLF